MNNDMNRYRSTDSLIHKQMNQRSKRTRTQRQVQIAQSKNGTFDVYKKIKEITEKSKNKLTRKIENEQSEIIVIIERIT